MIAPLIALILQAAQPAEAPLPEPAQEARAQALMRELRCTVCENEPVSQSTADMAVDARRRIRAEIAKGASDSQVREFFVSRYGQYVSFRPPAEGWTLLLWAFPFALLAGAGIFMGVRTLGKRKRDLVPLADDRDEAAP
jgi:cytochrome c-type biogenesis protein CcmH